MLPEASVERDVLCFVDREGSASIAVRGASSAPSLHAITMAAHLDRACTSARTWVEWIDTASSRDGNNADMSPSGFTCVEKRSVDLLGLLQEQSSYLMLRSLHTWQWVIDPYIHIFPLPL